MGVYVYIYIYIHKSIPMFWCMSLHVPAMFEYQRVLININQPSIHISLFPMISPSYHQKKHFILLFHSILDDSIMFNQHFDGWNHHVSWWNHPFSHGFPVIEMPGPAAWKPPGESPSAAALLATCVACQPSSHWACGAVFGKGQGTWWSGSPQLYM